MHQLLELGELRACLIAFVLQQAPAGVLQDRFVAVPVQLCGFPAARIVDRLIEIFHDVKAVENVQGMRQLAFDDLQVGFPKVAANGPYLLASIFAKAVEEAQQGFDPAILTDK